MTELKKNAGFEKMFMNFKFNSALFFVINDSSNNHDRNYAILLMNSKHNFVISTIKSSFNLLPWSVKEKRKEDEKKARKKLYDSKHYE